MENVNKIIELLKSKDLDAYIITSNDNHFSEYVPDYYKIIEFLTGFSGENATVVITKDSAHIWVDGRFFIQADLEVHKGINIMHDKEHNTPSVIEFLSAHVFDSGNIGFDGNLISKRFADEIKEKLPNVNLISTDLIEPIWDKRPKQPFSICYLLDKFFSGKTFKEKLGEIREAISKSGCDTLILSELEDQAWLFNLRADDIKHTPVFMAYTLITSDKVHLFINPKKIQDEARKYLNDNDVEIHMYNNFFSYISSLSNLRISIDPKSTSYTIYRALVNSNDVHELPNPTLHLKMIKNDVEIINTRQAHIKDGVAMVKAMYELYKNPKDFSEITYANLLEEKRKEQKGYIELSFPTIAGFKDHGAIVHYIAKEGSEHILNDEEKTFFLVDSGAHYAEGTTDITRTYALGSVSDEMKTHYTCVLKSHIALASAAFIKGCTGASLDVIARNPLWRMGFNFNHGTGHGVGHILSVHEGPQSINYRAKTSVPIEPGMITTDEPGIYIEGKYGIRIENELLCVEAFNNEFGKFYKFDVLTMCPIDKKAISEKLLNDEEKGWLNSYHKTVYNTLCPFLSKEEQSFLLELTSPIE